MHANPDSTKSDEQLANESLANNEVFAQLVERYEIKILRYVQRLTNLQKEHAEDILQEIFIKTYKNLNSFDPNLKFSSWIYRIAHNEAINHGKKISKTSNLPLETDDQDTENLIEKLASDTDIQEEAKSNESSKNIQQTLSKLPKKYRDVLILYYLEEKDYNEISDILKKPSGTIATLLHRAKSKFKSIYYE